MMVASPRIKRYIRRCLYGCLILVVFVAFLGAAVQTPPGKAALAKGISRVVTNYTALALDVRDVSGLLPGNFSVGSIQLADARGDFVTIEGLRIHLSLLQLLRGRIHLHSLEIDRLIVWQRPPPKDRWRVPQLPTLPVWPTIEDLQISRLQLGEEVLGTEIALAVSAWVRPVPGNLFPEVVAEVHSLETETTRVSLSYTFEDDAPRLLLDAYDEVILPPMLDLAPPLEAHVAGQGDRADWLAQVMVTGAGDTLVEGSARFIEDDDTRMETALRIHAGKMPVTADYVQFLGEEISVEAAIALDTDGTLTVQSFEAVTELLEASLSGEVQFDAEQADLSVQVSHRDISRLFDPPSGSDGEKPLPIRLEASVRGPFDGLAVRATGYFFQEAPFVDADVVAGIQDPYVLRGALVLKPAALPWLAEHLSEDQNLHLDMDIAYDDDAGVVQIHRMDLASMDMTMNLRGELSPYVPSAHVNGRLEASDLTPLGLLIGQPLSGAVELALEVSGDADGLVLDGLLEGNSLQFEPVGLEQVSATVTGQSGPWTETLPGDLAVTLDARAQGVLLPGLTPMDWDLEARVEAPTPETILVRSMVLSDGNIRVDLQGGLDLAENEIDLTVETLVAALRGLPLDTEALPEGSLRASASVRGSFAPPALEAELSGTIDPGDGVPDAASVLAGEQVRFALEGHLLDQALEISTLTVSGAAFSVDGSAAYDLGDGTLQSTVRAAIPDLQPLGSAFDQEISGALLLEALVSGPADALTAQADVTGTDLVFSEMPPAQLALELQGAELTGDAPQVDVRMTLEADGERLTAEGVAALESGTVVVAPLEVRSGDNIISGRAAYVLETGMPEARLEINLADLNTLGRMAGLPLAGMVEGVVLVDGDVISGALEARGLSHDEIRLEHAVIDMRAQREETAFSGSFTVSAENLVADPVRVDTFRSTLEGTANEVRMNTQVDGMLDTGQEDGEAFSLLLENRVFPADRRVILDVLTGQVGDFDLILEHPATIEAPPSGLLITPLALRFGSGRLEIEGQQGPESLSGNVRIIDFPLSMSALVMDTPLSGQLDGEIVLGGSPAAPELTASFSLADVRIDQDRAEAFAPLDAQAEILLAGNRLSFSGDASMEDILNARAEAALPLQFQVQPWTLETPTGAGLTGQAEFDVHFQPLLNAMGLVEHYLDGVLSGTFTLGGSPDAPDIRGEAVMRDARYENALSGTILRNLNLRITAEGDALRIAEFSADTGSRGSLRAEGELFLQPAGDFPFNGRVVLDDAQFAGLDYLDGRARGVINAEGTVKDILVHGELTISPVNVSIPDQSPVREPQVLEVTEIQDSEVVAAPPDKEPGFASRVRLAIDCNIPGRVYVRAPILDSEWGGNLHVGGTLADMQIDGRINVLRGHLDFLSRRFMLRDSAILFLGGAPTRPYLDMLAVVETASLTARLRLQGELEHIQLDLSSEPSLPQDEILSHILFGRDLAQISPLQAVQLARIASMFNGGLAGLPFFSGQITLPGIDRIDIRTGERADEVVVGMGRYFTDSVYVEVEQGTATESGKVSVEVELSPQISVKGDVDAGERSSIGVFWSKDY